MRTETTDPLIEPANKVVLDMGHDQFFDGNAPTTLTIKTYRIKPETMAMDTSFKPDPSQDFLCLLGGGFYVNMTDTRLKPGQSAKVDILTYMETSEVPLKGDLSVHFDMNDLLPVSVVFPQAEYSQGARLNRVVYTSFVGYLTSEIKKLLRISVNLNWRYGSSPNSYEFISIKFTVRVRGWLVDQIFYKPVSAASICDCCREEIDRERCEHDSLTRFLSGQCSGGSASPPSLEPSVLLRSDSIGSCSSFDII